MEAKDFSIIIPSRGNALGLWATIHSCEEDLRYTDSKYDYYLFTNGEPVSNDTKNILKYLEKAGKLGRHLHSDDSVAPHVGRQRAAQLSDSKYYFFFDNHCLVGRDYFKRALLDFAKYDIDVLHSTTLFLTGSKPSYEYKLCLDYNFWGQQTVFPQIGHKPYRVAAGGHGGFAVKRSTWESVGAYGPDDILVGYGGEEMLLDLKVGMYGGSVYVDPLLLHYHYPGVRGYSRHYTDEYYINMMACANVIGGEKWLNTVYESFSTKAHMRAKSSSHTMFELMQTAVERSAEYAAEVASKRTLTLDQLLEMYRAQGVAM